MGVMSRVSRQAMQGGEGKLNMSKVVWMQQWQGAERRVANFKRQLSLVPRWVPSCTCVLMSNSTIPKSSPVLVGNLSTGYLHTGDLYVQVFPQMNPQVPVQVLVLMLSPTQQPSLVSPCSAIKQVMVDHFVAPPTMLTGVGLILNSCVDTH